MTAPATELATYNFAYLDEQTKRMIRRAILKGIAVPGYQVPFASREMPMPYGWGTGGVQVTAACLTPDDTLKVIDQGADDTTNAVSIRKFFQRTAGVTVTTATNGSFSVPATVDVRGAKPVITIRPDIRQIDLGPIATAALNKDTFTGRMNFNGSVTMTGNDVDSWLRTAQGPNTLRLNDGLIKGVNVTDALFNALGQYQVLLPALTGRDVNTLKGKVRDTEIVSFLGETSLNQGVVSNNAMKADLKDVKVGGSGTYNLFTQDVDYRFQLRLDQRFWGEKYAKMANYDIPVRCNGNLKASLVTLCALDRQDMQGLAAQMAQGRLNEELDRGKDRLQEKLGEKLDPQQQEAVKQIFDLFKR